MLTVRTLVEDSPLAMLPGKIWSTTEMSTSTLVRTLVGLTGLNIAITASSYYHSYTLLERNYEDGEARMDELEGTLRGHIGLIEESLERIEGSTAQDGKGGWGKGMGSKTEELYGQRGKNEKKGGK